MKCSALISVDKRVVFSESESIGPRKGRQILFPIMPLVFGSRERGFQHSAIAYPIGPAKQCQLFGVHIRDFQDIEPNWLAHFAKARNVS